MAKNSLWRSWRDWSTKRTVSVVPVHPQWNTHLHLRQRRSRTRPQGEFTISSLHVPHRHLIVALDSCRHTYTHRCESTHKREPLVSGSGSSCTVLTCNHRRLVQWVHQQPSNSSPGRVRVVRDGQLETHVPACHGATACTCRAQQTPMSASVSVKNDK